MKVHKNTLRPVYTMGLGLMSLFLFLILVATGILLMFYYVPSTTQAYDRMLDLRGTVAFGLFLRNLHRWSAHGMVAMVFLHMCRVFFTGGHPAKTRIFVRGYAIHGTARNVSTRVSRRQTRVSAPRGSTRR